MQRTRPLIALAVVFAFSCPAWSQVLLTGRLQQPRTPGSDAQMPLSAIYAFASRNGPLSQASAFRTWETQPAGWYRLSGPAGTYTMVFTNPAGFMRPVVLTNVHAAIGDRIDRNITPRADYAVFQESEWDRKAAHAYYQLFVARGKSLTQVGFRVAHDGVDGFGPGSQNLRVSIHSKGPGTPDTWPQVGPAMPVLDVDSGGAKNYTWSAGWDSGQVPLVPGQTYAVCIQGESPDSAFQPFWRPSADAQTRCYRVARDGAGYVDHQLWMSVGTDGDGLLIPYNKHIQKQFTQLTRFSRKWSQTYVPQGKSLAGVILYAATSGIQPSLMRQRVAVRVRRGGNDGPVVGVEKIAIGNGNYTGDASWGVFAVAYAPGEVRLEPGQTYAIEFESIENYETLHGFVNIKGQVSDDRPGFNPYRKHPLDTYPQGKAFFNATEPMDYSLDMQVIEYEHDAPNWSHAVERRNLLANGDMEAGALVADDIFKGRPASWQPFSTEDGTAHAYLTVAPEGKSRVARITARPAAKSVDGGYVQRVDGLSHLDTYRLSGRIRSSSAVDDTHQCYFGYDPTGQTEDPKAPTIVWSPLPAVHGIFVPYNSPPIRPAQQSISVWLRARCTNPADAPFKADYDDIALQRTRTDVPDGK